MTIVLAVGTSMPLSMIVVQTQQVAAAVIEIEHDLLELALAHLPVTDRDPRLRHELRQLLCGPADRVDAVVDEVHLPAASQLAQACLAHHRRVPFRHERLDREPRGGRRGDQRQVAQAAQRTG